jgi:DNA repair protein RecN (Recombination protein N)
MLQELRIENIVLIKEAQLSFDKNFVVLSGETGAGKSAILEALKLILGERADQKMVRHGQEKGVVEGLFSLEDFPGVIEILKDSGIDGVCEGNSLLIRREITQNGRNRCFMNHQMVQQALVQKVGKELAEIVGQHASLQLFELSHQRELLDIFAQHMDLVVEIGDLWQQYCSLERKLTSLQKQKEVAVRESIFIKAQLEELNEACLQENEEELLFEEYSNLIQNQETVKNLSEIDEIFHTDTQGVLSRLKHVQDLLEKDSREEEKLQNLKKTLKESCEGLQDFSFSLNEYQSTQDCDPYRLEEIDQRLQLINKLKRKYSLGFTELTTLIKELEDKLDCYEHTDELIDSVSLDLEAVKVKYNKLCSQLSDQRRLASLDLQKGVMEVLKELHMPNVAFQVEVRESSLGKDGKDEVEYSFRPNLGERWLCVRQGASGGELSRVLLALKACLAQKQAKKTLILDEVDSGIGGETAIGVGKLLRKFAKQHQTICVTHLAQIASQAQEHFLIEKKEHKKRTLTLITKLDSEMRKQEIARMLGGSKLGKSTQALAEEILI